jgi:GAF domain-containing protein
MSEKHPLDFLASTLADVTETEEAITKIVSVATEAVRTDFGGITLIRDPGERFETISPTHPAVIEADRLQYVLGEGPCVDSALESRAFFATYLPKDPRWPTWGPRVSEELGFFSILSCEIHGRGKRIGALNLYGDPGTEFLEDDFELTKTFAHQASLVMGFVVHEAELLQAMDANILLGQAQGILMQRFNIGSRTASALLHRYASSSETNLQELAEKVVQTRHLPDHPADEATG